jgi:protein-tyrosine phosphatase
MIFYACIRHRKLLPKLFKAKEVKMQFADIHIHALCGVDDGAKTAEEMFAMIDAAYSDGTRLMCLTPHFYPGMFGEHRKKTEEAFGLLEAYVSEKYPDMEIHLGNEMRFAPNCHEWLDDGVCFSMCSTRYVLTEFSFFDSSEHIVRGLESMFNHGYIPILAHAERYPHLSISDIRKLRAKGVLIQLDSMSIMMKSGFKEWFRSNKLLYERIADFVSSDAHDLKERTVGLRTCFEYVQKKYGTVYAEAVFYDNAREILCAETESEV